MMVAINMLLVAVVKPGQAPILKCWCFFEKKNRRFSWPTSRSSTRIGSFPSRFHSTSVLPWLKTLHGVWHPFPKRVLHPRPSQVAGRWQLRLLLWAKSWWTKPYNLGYSWDLHGSTPWNSLELWWNISTGSTGLTGSARPSMGIHSISISNARDPMNGSSVAWWSWCCSLFD